MKNLGVNEIREKYLTFFEQKNHLKLNSFSLIPQNDKSLLLINSGMAPLKPFFTGRQIPPNKRVTTCQKCIRTGDIENVGKTARHGTFFEMLGNFSFGDYFKEEAIKWAWEFFTKVLQLPEERLYVSVYEEDDEAFDIWNKKIGIDKAKIVKLGKEDNFWEHGTGPCGPCSEIYFDKGEKYGCKSPNCYVGCDCDRYMEIWNLVFTQFYKEEDGTYTNLKNPNIDTGMGLERIATVMQNVNSIFEIDTIKNIRDEVCKIANVTYGKDAKNDVSIRVITDHIRSITFMTSDGVTPSNEGRGYVLRRLIRRAVRHARLLGIQSLFLASLCKVVIKDFKHFYKELEEKQEYIYKILTIEEEKFYTTLDNGLALLKNKIDELKKQNIKILNGEDAFKFYDTYGFPLDLMKEILEEEKITVDEKGFLNELEKQKNKARLAREEDNYMGQKDTIFNQLSADMQSEFLGYDRINIDNIKVLAIVSEDKILDFAKEEDSVYLILDKTPFYAEMGGQVGDCGIIKKDNTIIEVKDCFNINGKIVHKCIVKSGIINTNDIISANVFEERRLDIARNHTATHILHKVLKNIFGGHVEQAGSLVSQNRLRFDFTHFNALTKDEILKIEQEVNYNILKAYEVITKEMDIESAKKEGAIALFGEKYANVVRVVFIGRFSIELCGGTHVLNTGQIGSFKIVSESGVAAGVRRIEAVTGINALDYNNEMQQILFMVCENFKSTYKNVIDKSKAVLEENKKLYKEIEQLKFKLSKGEIDKILTNKHIFNEFEILIHKMNGIDADTLKNMADEIKQKLNNYIILLASVNNDKINFIAMACEKAIKEDIKASDIVKISSSVCGGGGGGKPNMALAGGKDIAKLDKALEQALQYIKNKN